MISCLIHSLDTPITPAVQNIMQLCAILIPLECGNFVYSQQKRHSEKTTKIDSLTQT